MTSPTTNNSATNTADTLIKDGTSIGVSVVEAAIIADVPWLGYPGIKQIWEALFSWIAGYFSAAAQKGVNFAIIDTQVDGQVSDLSKALAALQIAYKSGNQDEISKALNQISQAQSNLANDNGSSTAK